MNTKLMLQVAAALLLAAATACDHKDHAEMAGPGKDAAGQAEKKSAKYVCPMGHYEGDKPGKCPK